MERAKELKWLKNIEIFVKENIGKFYILKCDISKFFASIDKDLLKKKIQLKMKEKDSLKIVFDIIDSEKEGLSIRSYDQSNLSHFLFK